FESSEFPNHVCKLDKALYGLKQAPRAWKAFTRSPIQYKEYLSEFWYSAKALDNSKVSFSIPTGEIYGAIGLNTFRKAIGAHYMSHFSDYMDPPSIDIVRTWFTTIGYEEEVSSKGTLKKSILPPSVNNWVLNPNHTEGPPFIAYMLAICNAKKPVAFKAPRTSSQTEKKVSQGTNPGAKAGHKKKSTSSKQPPMSSSEATKGGSSKAPISSKTSPSRKRKESSSAKDSNPSQPLISTPVDTGMHKEDQQVVDGPTSLGVTNEEGAHPQLSSDKTKFVSDGLETVLATPETKQKMLQNQVKKSSMEKSSLKICEEDEEEDTNEEIHSIMNDKTEDISATIPPSPRSIQIQELTNQVLLLQSQKHVLETEKTKSEAEFARLKAQHPPPNMGQLNELLVKSLAAEFLKNLYAHDFHSSLPTELKELPSKLNELIDEVKALKTQVHGLEIEEIPTEFLSVPNQVASVQAKLKTLDALPSLLLKDAKEERTKSDSDDDETHVTSSMVESSRLKKAKKFDFVTKDGKHINLTKKQIKQQMEIEEEAKAEAARRECEIRKEEFIDLVGPEVLNKYYNDKLQYDRYCDKMINRIVESKISNCDVLTKKGPITLKVYKEDDTSKIILNFKASDLHLGE
nr:reverse transcriptase [Tanacetum cinerariifolium]